MKIAICIVLMESTFSVWKMRPSDTLDWLLPIITVFWIVLMIIEGIKIRKKRKWSEEKEEDERELIQKYKAGYITFSFNITFLTILFFFYSRFSFEIFQPVYALVAIVILNVFVYFGTKIYLIFLK